MQIRPLFKHLYANIPAVILRQKAVFFLIILDVVFFHELLLNPNNMLSPGADIAAGYAPWFLLFTKTVHTFGQLPLWNPLFFSGTSFIGNPQAALFYPLHWLFFITPFYATFGYIVALDVLLMGIFTYFYCKIIKQPTESALLSAIILMFSGTVLTRIYPGHFYILNSFCWFPGLLYLSERYLQKKFFGTCIAATITFALMYLAGSIQIAFYSTFFVFLYYILRYYSITGFSRFFFPTKLWLFPLIVLGGGIGLTAVQLLPQIELSSFSGRGGGLEFMQSSSFSSHPYQILTLLLPHFFGDESKMGFWGKGNFWETCGYIGIIPFILALLSLLKRKNTYITIFLLFAVLTTLLSFGNHTPVFYLFYKIVPGFDLFRAPARFLFIYAFSMSVLAGFGLQISTQIANHPRIISKLKLLTIVTFLLALACLLFLMQNKDLILNFMQTHFQQKYFIISLDYAYSLIVNDILLFWIMILCFLFIFTAFAFNYISRNIFLLATFSLVFIDIWGFSWNYTATKPVSEIIPKTSLITYISKDKGKFRILDMSGRFYTQSAQNNIENSTGYDPLFLNSYREYLWKAGPHLPDRFENFIILYSLQRPDILRRLNVKYILAEKPLYTSGLTLITHNHYYLYRVNNFLPRAYVTSQSGKINDIVRITIDTPNKIMYEVTNKTSGQLTLSELYYPGWEAFDNGKKVQIIKVDTLFQGLHLPAGKHIITFIYNPLSFQTGKVISLVTGGILGILVLFTSIRNRRKT